MNWYIGEILRIVVLVVLAVGLHQFIRRFGKTYATDVFRYTPEVGRYFLVLADISYYLIFVGYILFTVNFERQKEWDATVNANQGEFIVFTIAGICLIIGVLHAINVFVLPLLGSILAFRTRVMQPQDEDAS